MLKWGLWKSQRWALLWAVLILILCNLPLPEKEVDGQGFLFKGADKLAHTGFFYVLTVLLFYGKIKYQHTYYFRSLTIFKILLITIGLGGGIELLQWKIFTYRSAEWWDFACNVIGCCMAIFSYILLHKSFYSDKDHRTIR